MADTFRVRSRTSSVLGEPGAGGRKAAGWGAGEGGAKSS